MLIVDDGHGVVVELRGAKKSAKCRDACIMIDFYVVYYCDPEITQAKLKLFWEKVYYSIQNKGLGLACMLTFL